MIHAGATRAWGPAPRLGAFAVGSLLVHACALLLLGRLKSPAPAPPPKALELVMIEVPKPPPELARPLEQPKRARPPPVRVAQAEKPPPREKAPPPPNEPPLPAAKPPPLIVGLTMSSTTSAGDFAAPVGNTLYGRTDRTAQAPAQPSAAAKRYVPAYQVDTPPAPVGEIQAEYPPDVRREEIEGVVLLAVTIDADGHVSQVKLLKGLDPRLDAVAIRTLERSRWSPAVVKGEPVSTEIKYNFRFELTR